MAWQFADWMLETTPAAQLAKLNQHIVEVTQKINLEMSSGPNSQSSNTLDSMRKDLMEERDKLLKITGTPQSRIVVHRASFAEG